MKKGQRTPPPELRDAAHERMMHSAGTASTYRKRLSAKGPELCVCTEADA